MSYNHYELWGRRLRGKCRISAPCAAVASSLELGSNFDDATTSSVKSS